MDTHNICLYKEVDKKYTGCNLKTTELLDCALIGVCAVIRLNTVFLFFLTLLVHFFMNFEFVLIIILLKVEPVHNYLPWFVVQNKEI